MARRKKQKEQEDLELSFSSTGLHPDTRRGLLALCAFAFCALIILSFLGLAGTFGLWVSSFLSVLFGMDRLLLILLFLGIGFSLLYPEKFRISVMGTVGVLLFFLSFNALLNLLFQDQTAGGHVGSLLSTSLPHALSYWGSIVMLLFSTLAGILLLFNKPLRHLFVLPSRSRTQAAVSDPFLSTDSESPFDIKLTEDIEEEPTQLDEPIEPEAETEPEEEEQEEEKVLTSKHQRKVTIPPDILDYRSSIAKSGDLERNRQIIGKTFSQFGIDVEMGEESVGPTVTQFTLRPAQGVKLSRIVGLQNDLALALAAHPIRIEAPIPGKSLVGIEIPNKTAATVSLRDIIEAREFTQRKTDLTFALGKDVSGKPWVVPLEKMPHILVAGATGSGKSVCLNSIIISFLYANGPDDLKLILVDPKRVELNAYAGIPHLLVPPIIKAEDTVNALKWTVREMERRLDTLSKFGTRDIASYNSKSEEKMPKIVVIIDELADLMAVSGREVEATITRIAQMSRAVGIHLVLATQRPSVDVITGVIKANIPARIAFAVASQVDSRTILDCSGAEKLLGRGDMLFSSAELSKPKRIQGAYVSEEEVGRVVDFLKKQGAPDYNYSVTEVARSSTVMGDDGEAEDPLFEEAVEAILQAQKASTSFLQRRLRIGYSRAARLIDLLEDQGVIGAGEGAKPREVIVDSWPPEKEAAPAKTQKATPPGLPFAGEGFVAGEESTSTGERKKGVDEEEEDA
ncbi:DNA translocase FtsK 4TM domain-containing protein [Candidatus Uhrbacteria bacterium]|nr:DNA translocase FtsK 4TM domain-containing protein [Candidatus Uhrbacteria bacterium]